MKTNFNSDQKKVAGLHKVHLRGTGISSSDCMSPAMYDELNDRGALKSVVYVCGQGWTAPDVPVDGYYTPNYEYEYEYEYDFEYSYDYEYEYNNTGNNNSGSQVGGSAPSSPGLSVPTPEKEPEIRTDCAEQAKQMAKRVQSVIDEPYASTVYDDLTSDEAYSSTEQLREMAGFSSVENGFAINYDSTSDLYFPSRIRKLKLFLHQAQKIVWILNILRVRFL